MQSSFDGLDVFGSGPHRFLVAPFGRRLLSDVELVGDPRLSGTTMHGPLELEVVVGGRLVAAGDAELQVLRGVLAGLAAEGRRGRLVDAGGRAWNDMTLVLYAEAGPVDRARRSSLAYEAKFRRLTGIGF